MEKELEKILNKIRYELKENIDEKYKITNQKFSKEKIIYHGVRTPIVRKIAKKYFSKVKLLKKKEIFKLSKNLFETSYNEETTIAIQWISGIKDIWEEQDFEKLENLYEYVNCWGKCDDFCLNVLSHFIVKFPKFKEKTKFWSKSNNLWKRRASAVIFIQGGSWKIHNNYLNDVLEVATELLHDREDLVQKGYGWMLKIASETYQREVFEFVMKHKSSMPRTALRYAIEKMPTNLRKQAMLKN